MDVVPRNEEVEDILAEVETGAQQSSYHGLWRRAVVVVEGHELNYRMEGRAVGFCSLAEGSNRQEVHRWLEEDNEDVVRFVVIVLERRGFPDDCRMDPEGM